MVGLLSYDSVSHAIAKEPCPSCGSRDNLVRYSDGHAYCFSMGCGHYEPATGEHSEVKVKRRVDQLTIQGEVESLPKRKLREDTCQLWGYRVGELGDKRCHFAYYLEPTTRVPVACKVRYPDKTFTILGDMKKAGLYGEWLWKDGGRMIVVTEGELDALSVSQAQGNKWPVCSVPIGAQGAKKALQKSFEFLNKFDTIVLMFDMDDAGRTAAIECAQLFQAGKVKIADLSMKDASDLLQANKGDEIVKAIWNAKTYRPDGIVDGHAVWEKLSTEESVYTVLYPWPSLNIKTRGLRTGELTTITAGSGIGKSAFVRELAYNLIKQGEHVGLIFLEENTKRTALGLMGIELNKPLHLTTEGVTGDELKIAFNATVGNGTTYLYDHFGSSDVDNLLSRIRYMAKSLDCKWIILDHLSIVVSGLDGGDERKLIDRAMTLLRTLVEETGIGLILVSHLKRPEGKGHEEGAHTSLGQLRGSAAIGQLSDMVIGLERDQQGKNPNETVVRILKNRFSGETGVACSIHYDSVTGRLTEAKPEFTDTTDGEF